LLYCLLVTGHPLPNTFYAKFASGRHRFMANLDAILLHLSSPHARLAYGAGFLLWGVGAVQIFRKGWMAGLTVVVFPVIFVLAVSASRSLPQVSFFYWKRYLLPGLPFALVTLAVGGVSAATWAWRKSWRGLRITYPLGTATLVVAMLAAWPGALLRNADQFAWNCQNIEEIDVAVARWLRDHVPPGETIGVVDAGAARYFGKHRILDVIGLNHHGLVHQERDALAELDEVRFMAASLSWYPTVHVSDWRAIHRVAAPNYTICRCSQSEMLVHRRDPSPVSPSGN
jgi:hypothetical protein